jgi:hypothetical protein
MRISTQTVLDNIDERLAEVDADIQLLEKEGHPTMSQKRSFWKLRRQVGAAAKRDVGINLKAPIPDGNRSTTAHTNRVSDSVLRSARKQSSI